MSFELEPRPTGWRADYEASFRCEVVPERDVVRVCAIGSLDMATTPVLEQQLEELRDAGFRRLIIDLGRLSFMDSTGCILRSNGTLPRAKTDSRSFLHPGHGRCSGCSN